MDFSEGYKPQREPEPLYRALASWQKDVGPDSKLGGGKAVVTFELTDGDVFNLRVRTPLGLSLLKAELSGRDVRRLVAVLELYLNEEYDRKIIADDDNDDDEYSE